MSLQNAHQDTTANIGNELCPPGSYGFQCARWCSPICTDEECDHVSGCPEIVSGMINTYLLILNMSKLFNRNNKILTRFKKRNFFRFNDKIIS